MAFDPEMIGRASAAFHNTPTGAFPAELMFKIR
jgi:hypothetical protein